MFPKNPFGGADDKAWIRYYRRRGSGANTVFEIGGASNDSRDHIALMPNAGGVGIRTIDPGRYSLKVLGDTGIAGDLSVTNGNVNISLDDKGIDFRGGARIYKKSDSGLKIKPHQDIYGIEFTKADGTTNVMSLKNGNVEIAGSVKMPGIGSGWSGTDYLLWHLNDQTVLHGTSSSRRYKTDIRPFDEDFKKILKIESKSFIYKELKEEAFGFIAEDLHDVGLQNLVIYDEEKRPDSIMTRMMPVYTIEVLKEHEAELNNLKKLVTRLENQIAQK